MVTRAARAIHARETQTVDGRNGRVYKDDAEKATRFTIFKDNVEFIESFNEDSGKPYKLGINGFADMTNEEFMALRNGYKKSSFSRSSGAKSFKYENVTAVPPTMDWRKKGAVTPIKDQGQRGKAINSHARNPNQFNNHLTSPSDINTDHLVIFLDIQVVVGHFLPWWLQKGLTTGKLISLSEQELVDCDTKSEDQGCEGGLMDDAFKFIIDNHGLMTKANYSYEAADGCNAGKEASPAANITAYEDVPAYSESALLKAAANQPVSITIDAGGSVFQLYSGGVFIGPCGPIWTAESPQLGMGLAMMEPNTGWSKTRGGTEWGDDGYIRMKRDINAEEGQCGIAMQASYPTA